MACPTPGGRGSTRPARTSGSGSLPDPMRVACRAGGRRRTARRRAGSAEFVPGLHAGRPRTRLRVRPDLADGAGTRTHAPGLRCGLPDDVRRLRCMSGRGAGAMRGCGRGAPSRAMVRPAARLRCWRDRGSVVGDSGVTRRRCGRRCRRVDAGSYADGPVTVTRGARARSRGLTGTARTGPWSPASVDTERTRNGCGRHPIAVAAAAAAAALSVRGCGRRTPGSRACADPRHRGSAG